MMKIQPELHFPSLEPRPIVDLASYKHLQGTNTNACDFGILLRGDGEEAPPLDSITVTTSSESNSLVDRDDAASIASTCSSVSRDLTDSPSAALNAVPPRSIFPTFWKSEGLESCPFRRVVSPFAAQPEHATVARGPSYANGDYQQLLREAQTPLPSMKRTRRNIFGLNLQDANNDVNNHDTPKETFRKTKSAPTLGRNQSKLPSALRHGKYSNQEGSGTADLKQAAIPRSVSFNDKVSVQVFEDSTKSMLVERWAAQGWDQLFH